MVYDLLIRNANVLDGSGTPPFRADVAIQGERICAIGEMPHATADTIIDAEERYLTPGFIDVHTHDDTNVIRTPDMQPKLTQGVTTVVVGNCGISASPVTLTGDVPDPMNLLGNAEDFRYPTFADYAQAVDAAQPSINVAALVGHTSLRSQVMDSFDRPANSAEISTMETLLRQALDEGALGLSSGLAYRNAIHAPTTEMAPLVAIVGEAGGVYTTHLRDEFAGLLEAMDEAFNTAREGKVPLVISHLKCAGAGNWGGAGKALSKLETAALHQHTHCDCYPYTAGSSTLDLGQVTDEIEITITWSQPHPEQARRPLKDIAAEWQMPLIDAAKQLQPAGAVYHNMSEADMQQVLAHPLSMVGSDGLPNDPHPHPRLWGAFPRVLAHYSRDLKLMPLAEAVRKMTSLSAANFGLADRGVIRVGAYADLTLFDLNTLEDTASYETPIAAAKGIELVVVNGRIAYHQGAISQQRSGRMLRRTERISHTPPLFTQTGANPMSITRYGTEGGVGTGGQKLPFARAVEAGGWLYVSGQTPMTDGEVVEGGIVEQTRLAFNNCISIMQEAGYGVEDVVHVTTVLTDARYFTSFNKVFKEIFGDNPPARICSVQDLVVDCKVEVDVKCFRTDRA